MTQDQRLCFRFYIPRFVARAWEKCDRDVWLECERRNAKAQLLDQIIEKMGDQYHVVRWSEVDLGWDVLRDQHVYEMVAEITPVETQHVIMPAPIDIGPGYLYGEPYDRLVPPKPAPLDPKVTAELDAILEETNRPVPEEPIEIRYWNAYNTLTRATRRRRSRFFSFMRKESA